MPGLFQGLLDQHEAERHSAILAPNRATHRVEQADGFLPLDQAATAMGTTEADVLTAVAHGMLEARADSKGRITTVRPAVVRVMGVTAR